jgi:hypothetical protein
MLVELAGVVVYGIHDDVPAARLLARRDRAGKGVVQQDPAEAGAAQLPGQGVAGEQDGGDLPGIAAAEAAGKVSVLNQVRCEAVVGGYPPLRCRPDVGHAGPLGQSEGTTVFASRT